MLKSYGIKFHHQCDHDKLICSCKAYNLLMKLMIINLS